MEEEEDLSFVPIIKKRTKGVRPSGSTSSLRSLSFNEESGIPTASVASTSKTAASAEGPFRRATASSLSGADVDIVNEEKGQVEDDGEEGNVAVIRAAWKKTPVGRIRQRESGSSSRKGEGDNKAKSRLSFGGSGVDEGESPTVIKRTSDSPRRLLRPTIGSSSSQYLPNQIELPHSLDQANISSSSLLTDGAIAPLRPESSSSSLYSKEYLAELKANTLSTPKYDVGKRNEEYDELTQSKFGSILNGESMASIPTSTAIQEAREKRERMRLQGDTLASQDNFVSLTVGHAVKGGESRLVREEDEIGDGDDDLADFTGSNEKIPLGKKANKAAAQKLKSGMAELIQDAEEEDAEDEQDEEAREWELAQIRRGGSNNNSDRHRDGVHTSQNTGVNTLYRPAPIPHTSTLPTLSAVSSRLSSAINALEASHTLDSAALDHYAKEREELDRQEKELRTEVDRTGKRNRWYGDFKVFVEELAAFLDEKIPLLEKVEKKNLSMQKERYEIVCRRRFEDDSDDVALFTGVAVPSSFNLDTAMGEESDEDRDDDDEDDDESDGEGQDKDVDEMGRSRREDDTAVTSVVRKARRQARQKRMEAHSVSLAHTPQAIIAAATNGTNEEEELWTDDELSSSDSKDLSSALVSLRESLASLFSDVKADDFRDPNLGIRKKFEEWRTMWTEDYTNAFGGLALVGAWEFWARVEMALWNPFEIDQMGKTPQGLDAYAWHASLSAYGHQANGVPEGETEEDQEDVEKLEDESETVVNGLVGTVVLPRLEKLAKESFDPLSRKQTKRAIGLVDEVSYCVEVKSAKFEGLVRAFLYQIQVQVSSAQFLIAPHLDQLTLPSTFVDPSIVIPARNRFLNRQVKLLRNALRWKRYAKGIVLGDHHPSGFHHMNGSNEEARRVDRKNQRKSTVTLAGAEGSFEELLMRELTAKVILPVIEAGWSTGGEVMGKKLIKLLPEMNPALRRRLEGEAVS